MKKLKQYSKQLSSELINIATIADIHWDAPDSEKLFSELVNVFISYLKTISPTIIAIVGDLMDRKVAMNSVAVTYCNKFIFMLREEFPDTYILLIHGTLYHDYMQLNSFNQYVGEKFRIYNTVTVDYVAGMKCLIIPEEYYSDMKVYDPFINLASGDKYDFVFIHGLFSHVGAYAKIEGARKNKICFNWKLFENIVYGVVNCGHIHIASEYKNIDYNGSFTRWCHGEEADKGFFTYVYDIIKHKIIKKKFIVNTEAPIYKSISYSDLPKDGKELYKVLKEYSKFVKSLRIIVDPVSMIISDTGLQQLVSFVEKFDNIIIHKIKPKLTVVNEADADKANELRKQIEKYHNKTFEEITIDYAKEKFNATISRDDIFEALK